MPEMDGVELIGKIRAAKELKSMYIILLTAMGQREDIIAGLEAGANDYIAKPFHRDELRVRIKVGERVVGLRGELEKRIHELEEALGQIKTLKGLIPMCAGCKKIRDDQGYWQQVEEYILEHSEAAVNHGLCPDCLKKHYPNITKLRPRKN